MDTVESSASPMSLLTPQTFALNPCTLTIQWGPYSPELLNAIEIRMLMEAFKFAYAHIEGPLPDILPTWGWGLDFFLSQLSPRYSPLRLYATFWFELISLFWQASLSEPLPDVISGVLQKDLLELLSLHAQTPVHISYHGSITQAYAPARNDMVPSSLISFSRTDFTHPQVVSNFGTIGLKLREGYDAKRRPRVPWSTAAYLQKHRELHADYLRFLDETACSSKPV